MVQLRVINSFLSWHCKWSVLRDLEPASDIKEWWHNRPTPMSMSSDANHKYEPIIEPLLSNNIIPTSTKISGEIIDFIIDYLHTDQLSFACSLTCKTWLWLPSTRYHLFRGNIASFSKLLGISFEQHRFRGAAPRRLDFRLGRLCNIPERIFESRLLFPCDL
jgi:hypothetical protein